MNKLIPIEFKNKRILTTELIAQSYEVEERKITDNFNNNKKRYIEDKHYFLLQGEELKHFKSENENFGIAPNVNKLYLWTERGALLHAKSLNTDKAWEMYEKLEDTYFKVQELKTRISQLKDTIKLNNCIISICIVNRIHKRRYIISSNCKT